MSSGDIAGANVREVDVAEALNGGSSYGSSSGSGEEGVAIIGTLLEVDEDLFRNNYMTVECLAHYDSFLFAKEDMSLERQSPSYSSQRGSSATVSDSNRRYEDGYVESNFTRTN